MERYYDFEKLWKAMSSAISATAREAGLEDYQPLVVFAVLEAIASPLKLMKLQGTSLTKPVGELGIEAYYASLVPCRVEELKSPHSLTVNGVMDDVVAALLSGVPLPEDQPEALTSATQYLLEGGIIEKADDGSFRLA